MFLNCVCNFLLVHCINIMVKLIMMHNGACINETTHEADHANYTCFSDISLPEPKTFHPIFLDKIHLSK